MKQSILGAACAGLLVVASSAAHAAPISGQGTWESTLQGRDLDGDFSNGFEAWYDTVLDITWLANANYAGTTMTWDAANAWAASLNPYGSGITGWRLPHTGPSNGTSYSYSPMCDGTTDSGFNVSAPGTPYAGSTGSEMAHMFQSTLGNLSYLDTECYEQTGWGLTNTGPFSNLHADPDDFYWSATEFQPPNPSSAWGYNFNWGYQDYNYKHNSSYAWAVHAGDVGASAVPVPAAAWLFASGLLGLIGVGRRHRRC